MSSSRGPRPKCLSLRFTPFRGVSATECGKTFLRHFPRSHSSDCRKMAEYMVRHSSGSLSVITFSTQNILELYFGGERYYSG